MNQEINPPENRIDFARTSFTPEKEEWARQVTNPNGRGNAAFDPELERKALPQDRLQKIFGWFHGNTGAVFQFKWASGRQDALVFADVANPTDAQREAQQKMIEKFTQQEETHASIH